MRDTSLLEIDLTALDRNYRRIQRLVGPDCRVCAVLNADGYGLGAVPMARRLDRGKCDLIAICNPSEALELWQAGISANLLVMRPVRAIEEVIPLLGPLETGQVHLTLHDAAQWSVIVAIARRLQEPLRVHLDLDTGMSRGGCDLSEASTDESI
jgi:alanine racemase